MSIQEIPLSPSPEQTFRIVLDSVPYSCRVYWTSFDSTIREIVGDMDGSWYMDLVGGDVTIYGMALVTGCDLLGAMAFDSIGQLWLVDTAPKPSDPTYDGLGSVHKLYYIPLADVALLEG